MDRGVGTDARLVGTPQATDTLSIFRYYPSIAVAQALFAVAAVVSAAFFLRLAPWARGAVEAVSWLFGAWAVFFTAAFMVSFSHFVFASAPFPFTISFYVAIATVGAVMLVLPVATLLVVRGKGVTQAFAAPAQQAHR